MSKTNKTETRALIVKPSLLQRKEILLLGKTLVKISPIWHPTVTKEVGEETGDEDIDLKEKMQSRNLSRSCALMPFHNWKETDILKLGMSNLLINE